MRPSFRFPDASKMRSKRVELTWHATELYGLLFKILHRNRQGSVSFERIVMEADRSNQELR